jgi:ribosomal protein S11
LAWRSCGINFPGKQKSTEVATMELGTDMLEIVTILGIKKLFFLLKGSSNWHGSVLDIFLKEDKFEAIQFKEITGISFNGCRKWKHRLKNKKRRRDNKNKED